MLRAEIDLLQLERGALEARPFTDFVALGRKIALGGFTSLQDVARGATWGS
jgi:hypothetical protein